MPSDNYLFDSWFAHDSGLPDHIESYNKDWIGPLRSNRKVTYAGEEIRVSALAERIDTFLEDSEQDLGLEDCEMQTNEGTSQHWHHLMAAYCSVRLDPD